jgi:hypothetical protein
VGFAVTTPSGTPISDSIDWIESFVRHFGSPNISYCTEICNWHKDFAHAFTFGCGLPPADFENADTIMLWGHNPANTWLAQASAITNRYLVWDNERNIPMPIDVDQLTPPELANHMRLRGNVTVNRVDNQGNTGGTICRHIPP